jgi:hypothetical protein
MEEYTKVVLHLNKPPRRTHFFQPWCILTKKNINTRKLVSRGRVSLRGRIAGVTTEEADIVRQIIVAAAAVVISCLAPV